MSGSASRLFMCRGCKLHFMLRPASLPPIAGLLTSRFGLRDLSRLRRPATRRSDAYRGGTCTRWRSAARLVRPTLVVFAVTAHHGRILLPRTRERDRRAADRVRPTGAPPPPRAVRRPGSPLREEVAPPTFRRARSGRRPD